MRARRGILICLVDVLRRIGPRSALSPGTRSSEFLRSAGDLQICRASMQIPSAFGKQDTAHVSRLFQLHCDVCTIASPVTLCARRAHVVARR